MSHHTPDDSPPGAAPPAPLAALPGGPDGASGPVPPPPRPAGLGLGATRPAPGLVRAASAVELLPSWSSVGEF
jgi:hypothetical protein